MTVEWLKSVKGRNTSRELSEKSIKVLATRNLCNITFLHKENFKKKIFQFYQGVKTFKEI